MNVDADRFRRAKGIFLEASRKENTAKLWRKANDLDVEGDSDWWAEVQRALEDDVERLREEIAALARQVEALQQLAAALKEGAVDEG